MVKVSVVLPCYNAASFIADAIGSIQAQTLRDWECIVIDDCSTDSSANVTEALAARDPRILPVQLPANGGASAARNAGLDRATGTWITLLDADDLYAPERLERLVALAEDQQADMVFDNQSIAEFPEKVGSGTAFHWLDQDVQPVDAETFFFLSARFGRSLNPGYMKPLLARSFMQKHALRYDLRFRSGQDYLLYADAFVHDPRCFATRYHGYTYRRRAGSLSRSGGKHLRNHARLSDEILVRHGSLLSRSVHTALAKRRRYFLNSAALNDLRVALADGKWLGAARVALTTPRLALGVVHSVRKRLAGTR